MEVCAGGLQDPVTAGKCTLPVETCTSFILVNLGSGAMLDRARVASR